MEQFGWILLGAIVSGISGFLGSYLKKKGENLATHEDLDNLVKQLEATTAATKAIEARISDEFWNKQKQWEMKRDALFKGVKALAALDDVLMALSIKFNPLTGPLDPIQTTIRKEERAAAISAWNAASANFEKANSIASLVGGISCTRAFSAYNDAVRNAFPNIVNGGNQAYSALQSQLVSARQKVLFAVRNELGIRLD